jgi:hypothetical protein
MPPTAAEVLAWDAAEESPTAADVQAWADAAVEMGRQIRLSVLSQYGIRPEVTRGVALGGGTYESAPVMVVSRPDYDIWLIPYQGPPPPGVSWTIGPSCVGRLIGRFVLDLIRSYAGIWRAINAFLEGC